MDKRNQINAAYTNILPGYGGLDPVLQSELTTLNNTLSVAHG